MNNRGIGRYGLDVTNYRLVGRIFGLLLIIEGLLLLLPMLVCIMYGESDWQAFAITMTMALTVGLTIRYFTRDIKGRMLYRREGYIVTSGAWVLFTFFGMIPFMLSTTPLDMTDAFFETMSGFTTTGASVIGDVDAQSHGILMWRAQTQWTGGLGIVLFMLALLPSLNQSSSLPMFNAEITGVTHDKLHPRIRQTAKSLWIVYGTLTFMMIVFLMIGPMDWFDAVCHSFSTLSTGGFSTHNEGVSYWHSDYVAVVMSVFMLMGGINFILLYNVRRGMIKPLWRNDVSRSYIILVFLFVILISVSLLSDGYSGLSDLVIRPLFLVSSAITSTGYTYGNFELWGVVIFMLVVVMMIIGACAGSTTGGMKMDRVLALWKNMKGQTYKTLHPNHIEYVRLNDRVVGHETMSRIAAFGMSYMLMIILGTMIICAMGVDFDDSLFAVVSGIGNSGLGYGLTGVEGGFGLLPAGAKWVLSILMLVGRLEIFTITVLFTTSFWRR